MKNLIEPLLQACRSAVKRASESLSLLVNSKVTGDVQGVTLMPLESLLVKFQGIQDQVLGIATRIEGKLKGFLLLIINIDLVSHLLDLVLTNYEPYIREEDLTMNLEEDIIKETANVIIGNFISELNNTLKLSESYSLPSIAVDVIAVLLDQLCANLALECRNVLVFHINLKFAEHRHTVSIIFLLKPLGENL